MPAGGRRVNKRKRTQPAENPRRGFLVPRAFRALRYVIAEPLRVFRRDSRDARFVDQKPCPLVRITRHFFPLPIATAAGRAHDECASKRSAPDRKSTRLNSSHIP